MEPDVHSDLTSDASTTLEKAQNVILSRPSVDLTTSQLMERQKDRSRARPGETLSEEHERGHGGLSVSVRVRDRASEICAGT